MAKDTWVIEVRQEDSETDDGGWQRIARCGDAPTAVAITDALHNLGDTDLSFHAQVRMRLLPGGAS